MSQLPQCAAFDATHCPPHESRPPLQAHCPLLQVCPIAQARPHEPQFLGSVATAMHEPEHIIWPPLHVTPTPPVPEGTAPTEPVHAAATSARAAAMPAIPAFNFIW